VVWRTGVHPGADDLAADERRDKARSDAGVGALLFETYPIRYWDHYLGPREPRLFASAPPPADDGRMAPRRPPTPAPGRALVELDGGEGRDLLAGLDLWPLEPVWAADSRAVFFVADQDGRTPVFRVEVGGADDGRLTRLSADGAFSDLNPAPDGGRLYALRA